jgi:ADP-ribose pyrophosphatase
MIVYKNDWFSVEKEDNWHWIVDGDYKKSAAVLLLVDEKYFLFNKIYRKAIDQTVIEIQRGYGNKGETSKEAAIREGLEETGLSINSIEKLGSVHPNSGILKSEIDIFLARASSENSQETDGESESFIKINKSDIKKYLIKGELKDSFSLAALSYYFAINS